MTAPTAEVAGYFTADELAAQAPLPNGWRGLLIPTNTRSGDRREYILDTAVTEVPTRPLPLPLNAQKYSGEGHDGSEVVGLITRLWLDQGAVWGEGTFDLADPCAADWAAKLGRGVAGWVSVDLSDVAVEQVPLDAEGNELTDDQLRAMYDTDAPVDPVAGVLTRCTEWKLMGLTLVSGPAFEQARIEPVYGMPDHVAPPAPKVHTGAMIALVPAAEDAHRLAVTGYEPVDELHVTLAYLGDADNWTPEQRDTLTRAVADLADAPLMGEVWGHAAFNPAGDEPCAVYLVKGDELPDLHAAVWDVLENNDTPTVPTNYTPWCPHITAAYEDRNAPINASASGHIGASYVEGNAGSERLPHLVADTVEVSSDGVDTGEPAGDRGTGGRSSVAQSAHPRGRGRAPHMPYATLRGADTPAPPSDVSALGSARERAEAKSVLNTQSGVRPVEREGVGGVPGVREGRVTSLQNQESHPATDTGRAGTEEQTRRIVSSGEFGEVRGEIAASAGPNRRRKVELTYTGPVRFDRLRIAFGGQNRDIPLDTVTAALTASAVVYDIADFNIPEPAELTALTVTSSGRVFGHLADRDSCHIGFADVCVTPPVSTCDYAYFHQGEITTTEGPLAVGKITLGTGHANMHASATAAAEHYDNTGTVVAVVRVHDGALGPWMSGRILPGVSDEKVAELRRSGVSGDWRGVRRNSNDLELVAVLAVNVPGFPVPRTRALAASGVRTLVAAAVRPRRALSAASQQRLTAAAQRVRAAKLDLLTRRYIRN